MTRPPKSLTCALAALVVLCAPPVSFAQTASMSAARSPTEEPRATNAPTSAAALYLEAASHAARRHAELEQAGRAYDTNLGAQLQQEQRALAARFAATVAARPALGASDELYLGQLYSLAAQSDDALKTMRHWLRLYGDARPADAQAARFVVALETARQGAFPNAERMLNDYLAHEATPPDWARHHQLEHALAAGYRTRKRYDEAITHAQGAVAAAEQWYLQRPMNRTRRDDLFYQAAAYLADLNLECKQTGAALGALQALRKTAVALPSADLYRRATILLERIVPRVNLMTAADDAILRGPLAATTAPEVFVRDWIDQRPTTLATLRGRVVLLDFWATWCAPCRVALPYMSEWHERYRKQGLTILAVTQYRGSLGGRALSPAAELSMLRHFKRAEGMRYAVGVDGKGATSGGYNVTSIPTAILIDRTGRVRFISVGATQTDMDEIGLMIEKLLAEPAPPVSGR